MRSGGHQLTFIMAPNLHWPDTIFTHDAATNHLFTCDAFGMHYCTKEAFDPAEDKVLGHYAFYYEVLFGRASPWGASGTAWPMHHQTVSLHLNPPPPPTLLPVTR